MQVKLPIILVNLFCLLISGINCSKNNLPEAKIKILLTIGGHDFQQKQFFKMFDNLPGLSYDCIPLPDSASLLRPGLEKKYDAIVRYDMVNGISPEQQLAFIELLKQGIGLVSLHHNLAAHRDWDEYVNIIGGKYLFEPKLLDGKMLEKSDYSHDQDFLVQVVDSNHPITQGIDDFEIHDETYINYYTSPKPHILLKTDYVNSDAEIAWVKQYEKSPVCYLLLGHDSRAWENPQYVKILSNAIHWVARESKKMQRD